jgi:predicted DNA-binding transcriptional regulator AlpA
MTGGAPRPGAGWQTDIAADVHALGDEIERLDAAAVAGRLETLRIRALQAALALPAGMRPVAPAPSRALDVAAVATMTGMSKRWLYREAAAGRLPFARKLGQRVVFDQVGCERWLARRQAGS